MSNYQHMQSNRDNWEFSYSTRQVLEGAKQQLAYRESRVKVWTDKKNEVMKEIKSAGLTVNESIAEKMSNYTTARQSAQIVVDPTMQEKLDECVDKIREHRELVGKYQAWVQLLEQVPVTQLSLKHGDWMFFFGK